MSVFRRMTEADLAQVMQIIAGAQTFLASQGIGQWQDGYPDEAVMREDVRLLRGYVVEGGDRVLGMATVIPGEELSYREIHEGKWTTPEPYGCIHRVAVDAAARGKGVSGTLMRGAERVLAEAGMRSARIDTHRENRIMQGMLRGQGYGACGVIYLVDGQEAGAERIAFEKELPG